MKYKESELGLLPNDWEINTMENALDKIIDYRGKTPKKSESGIKTLSAKSVKMGVIEYDKAYYISELTYKSFMVRGFPKIGDILLTTEAPLGLVAKLDRNDVAIAQRLLLLRGKKNYLDNSFLMYYLMSPIGQHQLKARETGTTVKGIKQSEFRKCLISIPSLSTQKKIADILSSLDDKIENNRKTAQKLEEIAQAVFKRWFVDFNFPDENGLPYKDNGGEMVDSELGMIPKGWKIGKLGDVSVFKNGKKRPKTEGEHPIYGGNGILGYCGDFNCEKNAIIIGRVGAYCGSLYYEKKPCWISDNAILAQHKNKYNMYLLNLLKVFNLNNMHIGSSQPLLTQSLLNEISIVIQRDCVLDSFENIAITLMNKLTAINKQNKTLNQLRDTLLPKLMSGELEV